MIFQVLNFKKMLIGEISGRIDFDLETEKINQDFVSKKQLLTDWSAQHMTWQKEDWRLL